MVPVRLFIARIGRREPPPHEASQARVDESGKLWSPQLTRSFNGFGNDCVIRDAHFGQLIEPYTQQCVDYAISLSEGLADKLIDPVLHLPMVPEASEAEHAQQRAVVQRNALLILRNAGIQ
jgi:hypothetical protein